MFKPRLLRRGSIRSLFFLSLSTGYRVWPPNSFRLRPLKTIPSSVWCLKVTNRANKNSFVISHRIHLQSVPSYHIRLSTSFNVKIRTYKDFMQGKFFQRYTHLSLDGNVNTRRMSQPDMGSIFHIKKSMKYSDHRKLVCELWKLNAFTLLGN